MKVGFLYGGIAIVGMQLMVETLGGLVAVTRLSLFIIGVMLIVEGMAVEPKLGSIEGKINDMKEEIRELKYPLNSNNED
jgi:hypothetical protein